MNQTSPQPALKPVSESLFYMWRCVICMAHADGVVHEKERAFFDGIFTHMGRAYDLTSEHLETFAKDLEEQQDLDALLTHLTDPECKSLLIFFSQVVACSDGKLDFEEAALIGKLDGAFGAQPDTEETVAQIRNDIAERMKLYKEAGHQKPDRPAVYYALDALLLRLGIDVLD